MKVKRIKLSIKEKLLHVERLGENQTSFQIRDVFTL
jgi:hypothetical protein